MKLTVNNIDRNLRVELAQICEIVGISNNPDGVFLVWSTAGDSFEKQTEIIEKCVKKKIPMIIFDRNQEIIPDEISYLMSIGAFLWEPAVTGRNFFSFQPVWGRIPTEPDQIEWDFDVKRRFDLANCSTVRHKFPAFEKYYIPIHEIGGFNVGYHGIGCSQTMAYKMQHHKMGIHSADEGFMKDVKTTILIGTEQNYESGFLDTNIFELLENGVIPLLPEEHRWYHSVFGDMVIHGEDNVDYILKMYDKIAFGCIFEIYENLSVYLPECDVKNVAKRINSYFS